ncbi:MAG: hypothetical protein IT373_20050 [Polyangiaceae bacterium]|nr:hypothetical protein [Polyangiaceae bacterium]
MRPREHVISPLALLSLVALAACAGSGPPPGTTAAPPLALTPTVSAAVALVPSAGATASPGDELPAPPSTAPADLAALPRDAAFYGWARPAALDALAALVPDGPEMRAELTAWLGRQGTLAAALATFGVAAGEAVYFAVLPPAVKRARAHLDALIAGAPPSEPRADEPAVAALVRLRTRPRPGADLVGALERTLAAAPDVHVVRCPGSGAASGCPAGIPGLVAAATARHLALALRLRDGWAELDLALPPYTPGSDPSVARALVAFAGAPGGGPAPERCAVAPSAGAALCIDADRTAELGAAVGWGKTAYVVMTVGVPPAQRRLLLEAGRDEAARNLELAAPARRLLDDGSVALTATPGMPGATVRASWTLAPPARAAVEAAFGTERCADGAGAASALFVPLLAAFGDPGPDYARPRERLEHMKEAGWTAYPIAFARIWPNLVRDDATLHQLLPVGDARRTCLRTADGRLELVQELGPAR